MEITKQIKADEKYYLFEIINTSSIGYYIYHKNGWLENLFVLDHQLSSKELMFLYHELDIANWYESVVDETEIAFANDDYDAMDDIMMDARAALFKELNQIKDIGEYKGEIEDVSLFEFTNSVVFWDDFSSIAEVKNLDTNNYEYYFFQILGWYDFLEGAVERWSESMYNDMHNSSMYKERRERMDREMGLRQAQK